MLFVAATPFLFVVPLNGFHKLRIMSITRTKEDKEEVRPTEWVGRRLWMAVSETCWEDSNKALLRGSVGEVGSVSTETQ